MSEFDEKTFQEKLAIDLADAIYNSWILLAEAMLVHGAIRKEVWIAMLRASRDQVTRTHENSLTHYVLQRALDSYSRDDDPGPNGPNRPAWLHGVIDGGKGEA